MYMTQIYNYNALEIGMVLMWMGFPQLFVQPFLPKLTKIFDPRHLVCFGFFVLGGSFLMDVHMDPNFGGHQLIPSLIVRALAMPFIMVPLSLVVTYGMPKKEIPDVSTLTNVLRSLGGAVGIAAITTALQNRTREHYHDITASLPAVSEHAWHYLRDTATLLMERGSPAFTAKQQATAVLYNSMQTNAAIMAYNDVLFIMGSLMFVAGLSILLIKKTSADA